MRNRPQKPKVKVGDTVIVRENGQEARVIVIYRLIEDIFGSDPGLWFTVDYLYSEEGREGVEKTGLVDGNGNEILQDMRPNSLRSDDLILPTFSTKVKRFLLPTMPKLWG